MIAEVANRLETHMGRRFEMLEQRLDRVENRLTAIETQMVGINRSLDQRDRSASEMLTIQQMQQKATTTLPRA